MTARSIYQIAYLVEDIEKAAHQWARATGAGPFVLFDPFGFIDPLYHGEPCDVNMGIALGFSGELCVELIVQHDDRPSIYSDWLREHGYGMHHVAMLADDFPATMRDHAEQGVQPIFSGGFGEDTRLAYLDTRKSLGCFLEIVEHTEFVRGALAAMRADHENWDGSDIVRPFAP